MFNDRAASAVTSFRPWRLGIGLGLLAALAVPLLAQEPPPEDSFAEAVEVSVVNLDVFVTDKKGQPLNGLKREDFEVYEDGKPVEISNFYAESRTEAPVAAEGKAPADRPQDQRLRLVVFADDVNTEPQGRTRILERLKDFFRRELAPGDQVMLVRYNGGLEIRRAFTADLDQVASDLEALLKMSSDLRKYEVSLEHAYDDIIDAIETNGGWGAPAEGRIRAWAEQESAVVRGALAGLDSVVSWLAGVPGRKAILYVSDGLPLVPGEDLFLWASARSANYGRGAAGKISALGAYGFNLTDRFRDVTSHASRNGIAIYPIEAYGMRAVRGTAIQEVMVANRQNGIRFLAQDTGGQAMLNAADPLAALQLMGDDLASHYSLGYQPQRSGDGVEHKLEVKVKVKGAQARHRQWYRDKTVSEMVAERTLAVMRFGGEDNPLEARLEIGTGKEQGDSVLVPVRVKLPLAKLYLQQGEGKRSGRLRLYLVASGEGTTTPVKQTKLVTLEVPDSDVAAVTKKEYTHEIVISLKKGTYALGVGVRDELAAATSYLRKDFVLGETEGAK